MIIVISIYVIYIYIYIYMYREREREEVPGYLGAWVPRYLGCLGAWVPEIGFNQVIKFIILNKFSKLNK